MPLFTYTAISSDGKKKRGVIDADSLSEAKEKLRSRRVLVTEISHEGKRGEVTLSRMQLALFTDELYYLLRAGLPLYESLVTMEEKYTGSASHSLFLDLCDRIKAGESLSTCLTRYPKSFDRIYLSMVRAAEETGDLSGVFARLSALVSRQWQMRKKIVSALFYPGFIAAFCCIVVTVLLFVVVPSMQELYEGRNLHPLTMTVLGLSTFLRGNLSLFLIALIGGGAALVFALRSKKGKAAVFQIFFTIPVIRSFVVQSSLVRFCRSLAVLLAGGVPLVEGLSLSRKILREEQLEQAVLLAEEGVVKGITLSEALSRSKVIPRLVVRMLATAEETGDQVSALQNLAGIYEDEIDKQLARATALLQPALIVFLGIVVGIILLSVLLPLTDVDSFLTF